MDRCFEFGFINYISYNTNSKMSIIFRNVMFLIIKGVLIFSLVHNYYMFRTLLVFMSYLIAKGCHRGYELLRDSAFSRRERKLTSSCWWRPGILSKDLSYSNSLERTYIKISSVLQEIQGITCLLVTCIIGNMDEVIMIKKINN